MGKQKDLYDVILVVDLESTCWKDKKEQPDGCFSDIIEFGIAAINLKTRSVVPGISYYVLPTTSTISDYCVNLTKITPGTLVENGYPFLQVCHRIMEDYKSKSRPWISWGNYDRKQTEKQCLRENVPFPFGETHWNMRDLYTVLRGLSEKIGLSKALDLEGMSFIGQPHSGRDDAFNIARLFAKLVLQWENV